MKLENIEDCLEALAGFQTNIKIEVESEDSTILFSIARQVFRGKALTDRQLEVCQAKLLKYDPQFTEQGVLDLKHCITKLRQPLREIDRRKYVRVENIADDQGVSKAYVAIRFPFNKKAILDIEEVAIRHRKEYKHTKGTHIHYFLMTENTIYDIVKTFSKKEFEIDKDILTFYDKIVDMKQNSSEYKLGVYNYKLKNCSPALVKSIEADIGKCSKETIGLYKDRSLLYGLQHFDDETAIDINRNYNPLTQKIINRSTNILFANSSIWQLNDIMQSIYEIERFPLLIILPEKDTLNKLHQMQQSIKGIVDSKDISVMFRLDNDRKTNKQNEFNEYVRDNKLNNSLAIDTKIVYIIESKKLPKPVLLSEWLFKSVLYLRSFNNSKLELVSNESDLVIHYDEVMSQFVRFGNSRFNRRSMNTQIEEL